MVDGLAVPVEHQVAKHDIAATKACGGYVATKQHIVKIQQKVDHYEITSLTKQT
jgi:hypothetical protein